MTRSCSPFCCVNNISNCINIVLCRSWTVVWRRHTVSPTFLPAPALSAPWLPWCYTICSTFQTSQSPYKQGATSINYNSIACCVACLHYLLGFVPTASLSWQLTNDLWLHAFQPAVKYQNFRTELAEGVGEVAGVLFRVAKYAYEKVRGGPRLSDPFLLVLSWPCRQVDCTASGLLSCCFAGT